MTDITDRMRFNSGFHDGAGDVGHKRHVRTVNTGDFGTAHTPLPLGHEYKPYRAGYALGVHYAQCGMPTGSSEEAWLNSP